MHQHNPQRKIIHVDMDSFFVSIEERDDPSLAGKPVAVGGDRDQRGVISTANYLAREFGVHSAMPTQQALKLCPDLIIVRGQMDKYREASSIIRDIFLQYSSLVEPLSLDEAYIDVSNVTECHGSATWMAEEIRRKIYQSTKLTASAGISINKFIAKVASDWNKPNGQFVVPPQAVDTFVANLPIKKIYGVGPKTAEKMYHLGIKTCLDLRSWTEAELITTFKSFGSKLYERCRGIDNRLVEPDRIRKSISVETTFSKDISNWRDLLEHLEALMIKLNKRLSKYDNPSFKKVFIKIKYHDFQIATIEKPGGEIMINILINMLKDKIMPDSQSFKIRLLGIGVRLCLDEGEVTSTQMQLTL